MFRQPVIGDSLWERTKDFFDSDWLFVIGLLIVLGLRIWGIFWALGAIHRVQPDLYWPILVLLISVVGFGNAKS